MRTEKQIEASRLNGAKSRGPTTEQGKRNSRGHNRRHGILSSTTVLEEESLGAFNAFADSYFADIQPRDAVERSLVESMIDARWRLNRVKSVANTAIDRDMALQEPDVPAPVRAIFALAGTPTAHENGCTPDLFLRYETRFERAYYAALNRLTALRKGKPAFPARNDRSFLPDPALFEMWNPPPEPAPELNATPSPEAPSAFDAQPDSPEPATVNTPSSEDSDAQKHRSIFPFDPSNPLKGNDYTRDLLAGIPDS